MSRDIKPKLCPSQLTGKSCDTSTCPYIHLKDFQLTVSDLCRFQDLFYLEDLDKRAETVKVEFTDYEKELLQSPKPVLCWVCMHPIIPSTASYCSDCDIWICENCANTWKFPNHCPKCGCDKSMAHAPLEKQEEAEHRNKHILVPEIVEFCH